MTTTKTLTQLLDEQIPLTCGRCNGTGNVGIWWVENGVCFACGGEGNLGYTTQAEIDRKAKRREQQARYRARAAERKAAAFQDYLEKDPELAEAFRAGSGIAVVDDIAQRGVKKGTISGKQRSLVLKIAKEEQERAAQKLAQDAAEAARKAGLTEIPAGRYEVQGTVLAVKFYDTNYGTSVKMLVELEGGNRLWGTCPLSLLTGEGLKGKSVAFTAKIEPKEIGFAYYSRPTKARIVG